MRRQLRIATARTLLLRAAELASSRPFPAWIDAQGGLAAPVGAVPRVRDALVLRLVAGRRAMGFGKFSHAHGGE